MKSKNHVICQRLMISCKEAAVKNSVSFCIFYHKQCLETQISTIHIVMFKMKFEFKTFCRQSDVQIEI
jgi:hypothetical protein